MDSEARDKAVYLAKLAEQAERYDGMFFYVSTATLQRPGIARSHAACGWARSHAVTGCVALSGVVAWMHG